MFTLILIVMSAGGAVLTGLPPGATTGSIAVKTISFSSERHCEMAAKKLNEKTNKDVKVLAICVDRGLAH